MTDEAKSGVEAVRAVSENGKRWRVIPVDGDWEMQPVGHITAGQAERLCKRIEAALATPAASPAMATCNDSLQVEGIPRAENTGRYLAETNDGRLLYLNHANQWQEMPNILRAPPASPSPAPAAVEVTLKDGWLKQDAARAAVRVAQWDAPAAVEELVARLVKPLEWRKDGSNFVASAGFGHGYRIYESSTDGVFRVMQVWSTRMFDFQPSTLDEVKAAAEADHTARILSALDASALAAAAEREAALKKDRDFWENRENEALKRALAAEARVTAAEAERDELREALVPLAAMDAELLPSQPGVFAFDPWVNSAVIFDIGKDRKITAGDLRRARAAIRKETP